MSNKWWEHDLNSVLSNPFLDTSSQLQEEDAGSKGRTGRKEFFNSEKPQGGNEGEEIHPGQKLS